MATEQEQKPKIAFIGTGAIGSFYGGMLAKAGEDVHFLFRSDYETVRSQGLRIRFHDGSQFVLPVNAHASPATMGPCDYVFVATKTTGNASLPDLIRPLLHERTAIVTLQNGLGNAEFLAGLFGAERVIGGLCFICINRVAPGVIENYTRGQLSLAEFGRPVSPRLEDLARRFDRAGVRTSVHDNLEEVLWRKLCWNIPFNGLSVTEGGRTTDVLLADEATTARVERLMREVQAVAARRGIVIPDDFIQWQISRTRPMGSYKPSTLLDYLAGRELELDSIWMEPLRIAHSLGVPVPELERLTAELAPLAKPGPRA